MPPTDSTPAGVVRHLTRLLAALASKQGNELRIKQSVLDQVAGEGDRRALFESYDPKTEELVLTFRAKSLATYLIEDTQSWAPSPSPKNNSAQPLPSTENAPTPNAPMRQRPLTDQELAIAERELQKQKTARRIQRQHQSGQMPMNL